MVNSDYLYLVREDLEKLVNSLANSVPIETESANTIWSHVLASKGKMLRPALYFFICKILNYKGKNLISIALVSELVHTASLLHDDVVDNSKLRRNKPSVNKIWGDESAVLFGDLVYARASEIMAESGSLEIVQTFAKTIRIMSEGELLQLENISKLYCSESDYLRIITCKTAALMSAVCLSAGSLAQLKQEQKNLLAKFGEEVGIAFQLVDDALDIASEKTGKKRFTDLKQGKVTLPIIYLRDLCTTSEKDQLEKIFSKQLISDEEFMKIYELMQKYACVEKTLARAYSYTKRAIQKLELLAPEQNLYKKELINLIQIMIYRRT